jgi:hypothetical protein
MESSLVLFYGIIAIHDIPEKIAEAHLQLAGNDALHQHRRPAET